MMETQMAVDSGLLAPELLLQIVLGLTSSPACNFASVKFLTVLRLSLPNT
jgi:hypothetical protein